MHWPLTHVPSHFTLTLSSWHTKSREEHWHLAFEEIKLQQPMFNSYLREIPRLKPSSLLYFNTFAVKLATLLKCHVCYWPSNPIPFTLNSYWVPWTRCHKKQKNKLNTDQAIEETSMVVKEVLKELQYKTHCKRRKSSDGLVPATATFWISRKTSWARWCLKFYMKNKS